MSAGLDGTARVQTIPSPPSDAALVELFRSVDRCLMIDERVRLLAEPTSTAEAAVAACEAAHRHEP